MLAFRSLRSHSKMGDFSEAKPLDIGPIYFFDQVKSVQFVFFYSHTENTKSEELEGTILPTVTTSEENSEFHLSGTSQFYSVSKFSPCLKSAKICLQKSLLEEYKLTASEILNELADILQKYVEHNITFPVGIVNLINYNWSELTEGAHKCVIKAPSLKKHSILQRDFRSIPIADLKEHQARSSSREEDHKENNMVQRKHASVLVKQKPNSQSSQNSSIPAVIHFSLRSKICLENGWIFQYPYSPSEILKWKTVLSVAVKRLQVAIIQIKKEDAKLKKQGFNKPLILHHYNDFEDMTKFLNMNFIYPSGRLAVCQSYSALPWGGMYTNIFSDFEKQVILGTFTPFGCGSTSFPKRQVGFWVNRTCD
ncbi:hypothetical protein J0S82_003613 [Galemys pyrenaicus]|uniref:Uncharacterized protein n=1 Tax=Galemys pyrenaicus TaxID=202257 RepID=A0A8J6DPU2_GALPY|nr:hypothetical protein J0S82_003613 [Galemys pyrenaicus]